MSTAAATRATAVTDEGWARLAAAHGRLPTQDPAWTRAGLVAFGGRPEVVCAGDPTAPSALAPLIDDGRWLRPAASLETGEPTDLLARDPAALDELLERLVRLRRPLLLPRVPAGSPTVAALRAALGQRALVHVADGGGYPALVPDERWREPGAGLSASRRSALRRARRRAELAGGATVELLAPRPDEVDAQLEVAFAIEARSWKGRTGTALLQNPRMARFFRAYAHDLARVEQLRVQLLRVGDTPVAMQLAAEWSQRLWLFKIGYDERYAAMSPGQILLAESVADAVRRGLERYELLGTVAGWTEPWSDIVEDSVRVVVFPPSRRAAAAFAATASAHMRAVAGQRVREAVDRAADVVASRYVAGPDLDDAVVEAARCRAAGYATTIGHWGAEGDPPREVTAGCLAAAERLEAEGELSIKLPAMKAEAATLDALLGACAARDATLHFDALAPGTAQAVLDQARRLAAIAPGRVGCTLPGRWERSVADAEELAEHPLRVRVVKGEWGDPAAPGRDARAGFLAVVEALAASARHEVEVATQDAPLAREALLSLKRSGTPCELQVLHAMNSRAAIAVARELGVPVRVYVPYGVGRIPYELDRRRATIARFAFDLMPWGSFAPPGRRRRIR